MESPFEHILVTTHKAPLVAYLNAHPEYFQEALELAVSDKQPYAWRAAWLLWSCMEPNDVRVRPYVHRLVKATETTNDSQFRDVMLVLLNMDWDEEAEGRLFDRCAEVWQQPGKQPSVRLSAFKALVKIVKNHPELRDELTLLMQNEYLDSLTPGVRHSLGKLIKKAFP